MGPVAEVDEPERVPIDARTARSEGGRHAITTGWKVWSAESWRSCAGQAQESALWWQRPRCSPRRCCCHGHCGVNGDGWSHLDPGLGGYHHRRLHRRCPPQRSQVHRLSGRQPARRRPDRSEPALRESVKSVSGHLHLATVRTATRKPLQVANLTGATLKDANLTDAGTSDCSSVGPPYEAYVVSACTGVSMPDANLSGANLTGDDLSWADLSNDNLTGVTFTSAVFFECFTSSMCSSGDLDGVKLKDMNLSRMFMEGVQLAGANLSGANLMLSDLALCLVVALRI